MKNSADVLFHPLLPNFCRTRLWILMHSSEYSNRIHHL